VALKVTVGLSGALIEGLGPQVIADYLDETRHVVGVLAYTEVRVQLDRSLQHPTGTYTGRLTVQPVGRQTVVTDQGIVYGPWLEGTSHRNQSTRFKGYHSFQRAAKTTDAKADAVAEQILQKYLPRLGA
jgi:hypothetical protein